MVQLRGCFIDRCMVDIQCFISECAHMFQLNKRTLYQDVLVLYFFLCSMRQERITIVQRERKNERKNAHKRH